MVKQNRKTMYDILLKDKMKLREDIRMWRGFAVVFGISLIILFALLFSVESPNDLRDELDKCQEKLPSWNIRFECDYGDFLGDEGFQLSAVSNLTFSNYTLYKNTLKGLEFLDEECEVLE